VASKAGAVLTTSDSAPPHGQLKRLKEQTSRRTTMANNDKQTVVPDQEDLDEVDMFQDWDNQRERYVEAQNLKIHRIAYWPEFVGETDKPN
jgi:hypothetical protein